jgi:hypothetical protein
MSVRSRIVAMNLDESLAYHFFVLYNYANSKKG